MAGRSNLLSGIMPNFRQQEDQAQHDCANSNQENQNPAADMDTLARIPTATRSSASIGRMSGISNSTQGRQHRLKQRFSVIKKLGKGTYGKVQLAVNRETGREVAIKTIKKSKIESEQDLERVKREIQIMSSIEHPHIIHIYEVFENKDKIVLVMQYAPGGELYEYVSQSKLLDEAEARRLFRQISTAIFYCHQNKICHRDLKLENILLDEKNNAKLADFGLSNVFDKHHRLKTFCGSPLYASPEIVQGSPYEGPEVDCWSLGVLLYTLVYKAMPFDGSNSKRLFKHISEANYYEPKPESQASDLIRRLLCADPKRRATINDICLDPWVNGSIARSPRLDPTQQLTLLQVAQDMAKLTPVRLDLLMALLPPHLRPKIEDAAKVSKSREALSESNELNINKPEADVEMAPEHETSVPGSEAQHEVEPIPQTQPATSEQPDQMDTDVTQPNLDEIEQEEIGQADAIQPSKPETQTLEPAAVEVEQPMQVDEIPEAKPEVAEQLQDIAVDEIKEEPTKESEISKTSEKAQDNGKISATPDINAATGDESTVADTGESRPVSGLDGGAVSQEEAKPQTGEPEKPKKAKKKIVVVKKKKKVTSAKKDKEATTGEVTEPAEPKSAKVAEPQESNQVDKNEVVEMEITRSDDNQKTGQQAEVTKSSQESAKETRKSFDSDSVSPREGSKQQEQGISIAQQRRRSTLIADVSKKLLNQLAADAAYNGEPSADVKADQAQLIGQARVLDKKDEYERRASELHASNEVNHTSRKPNRDELTGDKQEGSGSTNEEERIECVVQTAQIVAQEAAPVEVEPKEVNPDQLLLASRCRSESIETIKPEAGDEDTAPLQSTSVVCEPEDMKPVRSSFEINLKETEQPDQEQSLLACDNSLRLQAQENQQPVARPVPITRSYKKVTFTRDGACITETGKIFATRGDDGSLRRIERKSKVTHYPAKERSSERNPNDSRTSYSEVVFEDNIDWSGETNRGNRDGAEFERLIRPTSEDEPFSDEYDDFFSKGHSSFTVSPFHRHWPDHQAGNLNQNDSISSLSSGSTDAFDDIFDNWTGSISMFGRRQSGDFATRSGQAGDIQNNRADPFTGSSIYSTIRRGNKHRHSPNRVSTSASGGQECSNIEAQQYERQRSKNQARGPKPRFAETGNAWDSRWDRDTGQRPSERPSSAFASNSARLFDQMRLGSNSPMGSGNVFFEDTDGKSRAFEEPLNDMFPPEPSDLMRSSDLFREISRKHAQMHRQLAKQQKLLWKGSTPSLFSPDEIRGPARPRQDIFRPEPALSQSRHSGSASSSIHQTTKMDQSQSFSGSKLHQVASSEVKPTRRNTSNIAECHQQHHTVKTIRRTISKASLLSNQLEQIRIEPEDTPPKQHRTCATIEMQGPTPNYRDIKQQIIAQNKPQEQATVVTASSKSISSRMVSNEAGGDGFLMKETDSRIQNWLQESSSNLSSSSGSKSSTSFTTLDGSAVKSDRSFSSLYGSLKSQKVRTTGQSPNLPPRSPQQAVLESSSRQDGIPTKQQVQQQKQIVTTSKQVILSNSPRFDQDPSQFWQQQQTRTISSSAVNQMSTIKATPSQASTSFAVLEQTDQGFGEEAILEEYESHSCQSSSLLDQLKSQGYRSMIQQRMMKSPSGNQQSSAVTTQSTFTVVQEPGTSPVMANRSPPGGSLNGQHKYTADENQHCSGIEVVPLAEQPPNKDQDTKQQYDGCIQTSSEVPADQSVNSHPTEPDEAIDVGSKQGDEEIEDEDIREAKAYVKAYVDRIKETELFLKTMQAEEEEAQRQRQQISLFDNLTFSTRLNGFKNSSLPNYQTPYSTARDFSQIDPVMTQPIKSGFHSAPVRDIQANPINFSSIPRDESFGYDSITRLATSRPSAYQSHNSASQSRYHWRDPFLSRDVSPPSVQFDRNMRLMDNDWDLKASPLDSINLTSSNSFRRSRLLSMSIDTYDSNHGPSFSSHSRYGRSMSQVRRQPIIGSFSPTESDDIYMTEYQRAYGASVWRKPKLSSSGSQVNHAKLRSSEREFDSSFKTNYAPNVMTAKDSDNDIDESMSSYRPSAYVPKVATQGRSSRSRLSRFSNYRRSLAPDWTLNDLKNSNTDNDDNFISKQTSSKYSEPFSLVDRTNQSCDRQVRNSRLVDQDDSAHQRRHSLQIDYRNFIKTQVSGSETRLSELEQRMEANKRRREELLRASKSEDHDRMKSVPVARLEDAEKSESEMVEAPRQNHRPSNEERELSPNKRASGSNKLIGRPSRLESMEARIKRRSFYVRVGNNK